MKAITVDSVTIGCGKPKIIVPMVGKNRRELLEEAGLIAKADCDIVEWRLDFFNGVLDFTETSAFSRELKEMLKKPLLLTFRTKKEGGERELSAEKYFELYQTLIENGSADLLDVELFMPAEGVAGTIRHAHQRKIPVLLSSHDFEKTPAKASIIARLTRMEALGADICKIAVMPQTPADVLTLLDATQERKQSAGTPLITMSMGDLGAVSRISGAVFGSSATFASLQKASAPGQIPVAEMRKILEVL